MNPICPNCGVELDANMQACPLCNYADFDNHPKSDQVVSIPEIPQKSKTLSDYVRLTPVQKRKLFWEVSAIILISGIIVTLMIDFVSTKGITWSKYSITACLVLFANITFLSFLRHRLFLLLSGSFLFTSVLLVLFDLYNKDIGWGTRLGIPILFSLYLIFFLFALVLRFTRQHGFNILAWLFLASGLLTLCLDGILSVYTKGVIILHWSLIVVVCIVPVAAILFYIHYRLKKGIELKQFFHI